MAIVLSGEMLTEGGVHFVASLRNRGPDSRHDPASIRAHQLHRAHGGLQHALFRAAPAGMRRADHARFDIHQQDRGAIGGHNGKRQSLFRGYDRVGDRAAFGFILPDIAPILTAHLADRNHIGRVLLMRGNNPGAR